jgi:hypothetical protein
MNKLHTSEMMRSARIAELRANVLEVAALMVPSKVELPRSNHAARARLVRLLVNERRRNAKLIAELKK